MTTADSQPHLRLVGGEDLAGAEAPSAPEAGRQVAVENRKAAGQVGLDPTDPRWVLAVRAYTQLQGTALAFERRQRLLRTARALGVRPFDANVIIAIVQDHARRGSRLDDAAGTLALLGRPPGRRRRWELWLRWAAAIGCAGMATAWLIWWVTGT